MTDDEGWMTLEEYLDEGSYLVSEVFRIAESLAMHAETRRMVAVTTRKYKARKGRRRRTFG